MTHDLDRLSRAHGIPPTYTDAHGDRRAVPAATRRAMLRALGVDPERDAPDDGVPERRMRAPDDARCFTPAGLRDAPAWGIFCQLYELRSGRNWGIGDFRDLGDLAGIAARAGADFVGVNPLHALFLAAPERCSPFAPSNRAFLNPLYIAVDDVPGAGDAPPDLHDLRAASEVDYPRVAALKLGALREIFDCAPFADEAARADHDSFRAERGDALDRHATFEALSHHMTAEGRGAGWRGWPAPLRQPDGAPVRDFARAHADEVAFHVWLQWLADRQLATAQRRAREAGMRVGLYLDLAVGEAPDGSAGWGGDVMLRGLRIGAPPDLFQTQGQDWGLAAPSPEALEARDFAPFRDMIRAQLSHAGALRIDHAMLLWQLFLIPDGMSAIEGGYLRYPMPQMLRALAEESHAARAIIVGEDLGSVPRGFRGVMRDAAILSYRLLYFEQGKRGFTPPRRYPACALACLSTHDLPTLADWWQGRDIDDRERFGLVDAETSAQHRTQREDERRDLLAGLSLAGELSEADRRTAAGSAELPEPVMLAAHAFLAQTPSLLMAARLADIAGPQAPTNIPGTTDEYPNWRKRSPTPIEALEDHPRFAALAARLSRIRRRPSTSPA
ncbi:4-alpha-glucanotransferase [Roseovarius spongiae]|uniref:4-alpha-glucanotransferase n=1 Tax=Roseovarius spongiae TaxID=2320272 RepID=A0A3A8AUP5_9RHOB|nr:4-alpha-glucanotransferase [Roseovarius spongiae]RKF12629.1 4-alpha-glucanotransferase [Roseovarius spongiae]